MIDISPLLSADIAVWPGDTPFCRQLSQDTAQGDGYTLSSVQTTLHLGAHVDAPNHYLHPAVGIAERSLDLYFGRCQVMRVEVERGQRILPQHLPEPVIAPRLLLCTNSFPDPRCWNEDFNAYSLELVEMLHQQEVRLVGIDTPSVDLFDDKRLEAHQAIGQHDMAILEGVVLSHVEPGLYTLCALPLRLAEADASPVRAVLLPH